LPAEHGNKSRRIGIDMGDLHADRDATRLVSRCCASIVPEITPLCEQDRGR
jgi:hypothetical protein